MNFYAQLPDHTGNVGQFSMANEPSLHIPYLYNYAGQPWKTQKRIRQMLKTWFRNDLMGMPGDEDGGGMTSFVVFSSLGFLSCYSGDYLSTTSAARFSQIQRLPLITALYLKSTPKMLPTKTNIFNLPP